MATGIIIHITVGREKRTEFFPDERIRIGSDETCDLQVMAPGMVEQGLWFEIENSDGMYRVVEFDEVVGLKINDQPLRRYIAISDGDVVTLSDSEVSFAFFSLETKSALITTNRETPHISRFIEDAALEAAGSGGKRD
ncbi:MAG TPA: FHA domain-containing protein, partial [Pyrinomonadaceae bacterium]